jgi:type III secretion protein F
MAISTATGLSFNSVSNTMQPFMDKTESDLRVVLATGGDSTSDLLAMQQAVTKWTLTIQMQTTIIKELGDAMKGVIQKSG